MGKLSIMGLVVALLTAGVVATATSQGQDDRKDKGKKGPPPKGKGFEIGKVLPPHVMEELELTEEQDKQIRELEKEVRKKLEKILDKKQIDKIKRMGPPRPRDGDGDEPPPREKGKDKGKGKDQGRPKKDDRPKTDDRAASEKEGGVSWFANWQDALKEAIRTNRPILLVSAAPHCAGVSGTW